jgi:hypothetical protein
MATKLAKTKSSKSISHKANFTKVKITTEVKKNLTFGLLLIGLLIAGFSFGAIMGLVDDANKPQTTTYTREAKAYNTQDIQPVNQNNNNRYLIVPRQ